MSVLGFAHFLRTGEASVGTAIAALLIGGSYHAWMSVVHAWRARRAAAR